MHVISSSSLLKCSFLQVVLLCFDIISMSAGSADPALQLGVFADRSESDEELLAALAVDIPSTEKPARGRGRRARAKPAYSGTKHALLRPHLPCAVRLMSVHCA